MHNFEMVILNFLRFIRSCLSWLGEMNIRGFPLDWVFHLIFAFLLMLFFAKIFSKKKSIWIVCFFIILKEVLDIFGKSRIEYIVAPEIDLPKDIIAGLMGIYIYLKCHRFLMKKKQPAKSTNTK